MVTNAAFTAAKKAIESTYQDTVTITEYQKIIDEESKLSEFGEVVVLSDQPCRLSYENVQSGVSTESATTVAQTIKMFLSPNITVNPGSKISITQNGTSVDFAPSGIPAIYVTHQEVVVDYFKGWA